MVSLKTRFSLFKYFEPRLGLETSTRVRRGYLQEVYHFTCTCSACSLTQEEEEEEERRLEERMEEETRCRQMEEKGFLENFHFNLVE